MKNQLNILAALLAGLPFFASAATNAVAAAKKPAPVVTNAVAAAKKPAPVVTNAVAAAKKPTPVLTNAAAAAKKPTPVLTNAVVEAKQPMSVPTNAVASVAREEDETESADDETESEKPQVPVSENAQFARFKTITDRMPFGPEPANFNPDNPGSGGSRAAGPAGGAEDPAALDAAAAQAEQQILSSVRVSAINVTPSGKIAVGFTDGTKQPSGSYYMKVGEERDGWKIAEADPKALTATLEKDGVSVTLKLGEGSEGKDGKKAGGPGLLGGRPSLLNAAPRPMLGARPGALPQAKTTPADAGSALANLRARRQRKEAERQAESARAAQAAEQAKKERENAAAEREQQREALLQIQEELRKQREAREQQQREQQDHQQQNPPPVPQE